MNPFAKLESDYGRQIPKERLREIKAANLEAYKREAPPSAVNRGTLEDRFATMERMDLTLEEIRAATIQNNLDLRVVLVDPTIASTRVSEEDARFEAAFTLNAGWRDFDTPTSSQLDAAQSQTRFVEPGVRIPLRTGGSTSISLPVVRREDNNDFSTLNPAYTSDLQFSISHPLLRNAGRRVATAGLRIAAYGEQAAAARTKLEVTRVLAAADRAYWRLYQVRRELDVRQQQYELAVAQLERAQRQVDAGAAAEIETVRAQAGVAERLEAIIVAQNNVLLQQREIKRIARIPGLTLDTRTMVVTTTDPDPIEYEFSTRELIGEALANRMELLELELQLAADAVTIGFERNQTLPLVTLDYTYRINGLGGSMQDSFRTLERNNFEDWELGLSAEVPLGNEGARARLRRAILTRLQRLSTKEARELAITQEVLNAIDQIDANWQRILAARQSVILNTRALQGEERQFSVGASTSTDVLDAAARLAEAQSAEIRALTEYQIAQVDLAFATGTLLGASRVSFEPAAMPDLGGPDPAEDESLPRENVEEIGEVEQAGPR